MSLSVGSAVVIWWSMVCCLLLVLSTTKAATGGKKKSTKAQKGLVMTVEVSRLYIVQFVFFFSFQSFKISIQKRKRQIKKKKKSTGCHFTFCPYLCCMLYRSIIYWFVHQSFVLFSFFFSIICQWECLLVS